MRIVALAMAAACAAASADTISTMTTDDDVASVRYDLAVWSNIRPSTKLPDGTGMLADLDKRGLLPPNTKNLFYLCEGGRIESMDTCIRAFLVDEKGVPVRQARTYSSKPTQVADGVFVLTGETDQDAVMGMIIGDGNGYAAMHIIGRKGLMQKYSGQVRTLLDGLRYNKP